MKNFALLSLLLLMGFSASAQFVDGINSNRRKRENEKKFSDKMNWGDAIWSEHASSYRNIGWQVSPGVTYMFGNNADDEDRNFNLTPSGLPGYYVEVGMEHLFKNYKKAFHYFDWALGMKHFAGQEKFTDDAGFKTRGQFHLGNAFARAGIHNVWQLTLWNFIDQSIGFNFDYRVYGGKPDDGYDSPLAPVNQGKMVGQLHYSIGWGLKVQDGIFIVPTVQTPILTLLSFDGLNPSHHWFNSRYQPVIFSVKFAWLFRKKGCPKVYDNGEGQKQSDQYQMGQ